MRFSTILALLLGGVLFLWMTGTVGGSGIGPNARVQVLTTEPVRIVLSFDAEEDPASDVASVDTTE